jgi:uncharacterized protein (TIRG00374 family)
MTAFDAPRLLRLIRIVVIAALAWSVVMAAAFLYWAKGQVDVQIAMPGASLVAAAFMVFVAYHLLRFLRWDLMLRADGNPVPRWRGLCIYMAGIALLPTPAKAGVAVRSVLLLAEKVPVHVSIAAYFAERLLDFVGLVLMAALLLPTDAAATKWAIVGGLAAIAIVGVVIAPHVLRRMQPRFAREPRLAAALAWTIRCFADASGMLALRRLPLFVALGIASNAAAGWLVYATLQASTTPIDAASAVGVLAVSHLSGSISMLPGGLGGFDLAMLAQLSALGVSAAGAVLALVMVRVATFWSGVAVGVPLLLRGIRR